MTEPSLKPEDAIRFALLLADGGTQATERVVIKALTLAGYAIVPAGAAAPGATPPPPPKAPPRGPAICPKCSKVRGNGGEVQECERTDCPF